MLKRRLEILFNFYCKIVKNYTGILNKNYKMWVIECERDFRNKRWKRENYM